MKFNWFQLQNIGISNEWYIIWMDRAPFMYTNTYTRTCVLNIDHLICTQKRIKNTDGQIHR